MLIHADLAVRDAAPEYHEAKRGSSFAALSIALLLVSKAVCQKIDELAGQVERPVRLVAVTAREGLGVNLIPYMMANVIGRFARVDIEQGQIVQANRVSHTRAKSLQRIVTPAEFVGPVDPAYDYILIDDHVGLGGTLANLKGWVELQGGRVLGASCLTASPGSERLAIGQDTLDMLSTKYGPALDAFWREHFGHGLDCLTDREGRALVQARAQSVDALADRLSQAADEARTEAC